MFKINLFSFKLVLKCYKAIHKKYILYLYFIFIIVVITNIYVNNNADDVSFIAL